MTLEAHSENSARRGLGLFHKLADDRIPALALCILAFVFFWSQFSVFGTSRSIFAIVEGWAVISLIAVGLTVTIIAGEIDLSVGSMAAFSGVIVGTLAGVVNVPLAVAIAVLLSALLGWGQGFVIGRLGVRAIVLTVGTLVLLRGLSLVVADNQTVVITAFEVGDFLKTRLWIFSPVSLAVLIIMATAAAYLAFHRFGRDLKAIGASRKEAGQSGVLITPTLAIAFAVSATCASLAGAIVALRGGSADPVGLQDLLLAGVTAAFVGGVSVKGGRGTILGALLGALVIQIIRSGMNFYFAPSYLVEIVIGLLLVAVVVIQIARERFVSR